MAAPTTLVEDDDRAMADASAEIARWTGEMAVRQEIGAARLRIDPADGRPELRVQVRWWDDIIAIHTPADGSPATTYAPTTLAERARLTDHAIEDTAAELGALRGRVAAAQAARTAAATPADRDARDAELDALDIKQRRLLAASQELVAQRSALAAQEAAARAALTDSQRALADAQAARATHLADAQASDAWGTEVRTGAAASVDTDAAAVLAGPELAAIDTALDTLLGPAAALLAHARGRAGRRAQERSATAARAAEITGLLWAHLAAADPLGQGHAAAAGAHAAARAELREAATRAPSALAGAVRTIAAMRAVVDRHAAGTEALLTASQVDAITETGTVDPAADAAALEVTRDQRLAELREAEHDHARARLGLLIADPDDDLTSIAAQAGAVAAARGAFRDAHAAYAFAPGKPALDAWERAVPTSFWELYGSYVEAVALLARLAAAPPADAATRLAAAESAMAAASHARRQHQRGQASVQRAVDAAAATLAALQTMGPSTGLTSLRGDD